MNPPKEASSGHDMPISCDTWRMRSSMQHITVEQARAVQAFSPASWTITETPEGWLVHRGQATLISVNSRRPRVFKSLDRAVRRLAAEANVFNFTVEAAQAPK